MINESNTVNGKSENNVKIEEIMIFLGGALQSEQMIPLEVKIEMRSMK